MRKILSFPLVILILVLAGCSAGRIENVTEQNSRVGKKSEQNADLQANSLAGLSQIAVTVKSKKGEHVITAEIAQTEEQRQRGLMYRKGLEAGHGMLFLFDKGQQLSFWMKNTLIPLDMLFIGEDHRIVRAREMVMPCTSDPCPVYGSSQPAKFVLEVAGGVSEQLGIAEGDEVRW